MSRALDILFHKYDRDNFRCDLKANKCIVKKNKITIVNKTAHYIFRDFVIRTLDPITRNLKDILLYQDDTQDLTILDSNMINLRFSAAFNNDKELVTGDKTARVLTNGKGRNSSNILYKIFIGFAVSIAIITIPFLYRRYKNRFNAESWFINMKEIVANKDEMESKNSLLNLSYYNSIISGSRLSPASLNDVIHGKIVKKYGLYKGQKVYVKYIRTNEIKITKALLKEIAIITKYSNENLIKFVGVCFEITELAIVTEYMDKGNLQTILLSDLSLDWDLKFSLIYDIIKGMVFIHNTAIKVHGHLRSDKCLLDDRFVLKITDFGLPTIHSLHSQEILRMDKGMEMELEEERNTNSQSRKYHKLYEVRKLWVAPEVLRSSIDLFHSLPKADVYSFAIILQEIILRKPPYSINRKEIDKAANITDIITKVKASLIPPFRPIVASHDCPEEVRELLKMCWSEDPESRPNFNYILSAFKRCLKKNNMGENFVDNIMIRMERYAENLDVILKRRNQHLNEAQEKSQKLLYKILPKPIAENLISGRTIDSEAFDCVTIYFNDIVKFTDLCSKLSPIEIITLLNNLYTMFDKLIEPMDVYKIETIGDAYMIASGVPIRNKDNHANEICKMAFKILDLVREFKINPNGSDTKENHIEIRIGVHSGPCAAGVVGTKMPRYCLFGESVRIASLMESTGKAMKIQISEMTKTVLENFPGYIFIENTLWNEEKLEDRNFKTYWLERDDSDIPTTSNYDNDIN
ncbi:unnamed protein product [Gordionus sp. m RMFG-2023]